MVKYLIDTVVISELIKDPPQQSVIQFLDTIGNQHAFISVMTIGEIVNGIDRMPPGSHRTRYAEWLRETRNTFTAHILPVDEEVAEQWGQLSALVHRTGGKLDVADGLIAATAFVHSLTVVTRNVSDFERTGVPFVNPWLDEEAG